MYQVDDDESGRCAEDEEEEGGVTLPVTDSSGLQSLSDVVKGRWCFVLKTQPDPKMLVHLFNPVSADRVTFTFHHAAGESVQERRRRDDGDSTY